MHRYLLPLIFLFLITYSYAQPNALVTGKINNTGPNDAFISAHVNQKYLTGITDDYYSNILEDGSFAFAIEMNEPQMISIAFNQNRGYVYLEPGDTLHIDCTANNFQYSFKFSGKSKGNNEYLVNYYKENPTESNAFKLVQYKQNQFWYTIAPLMDNKMRDLTTNEFISYLATRRQNALSHLFSSSSNLSGELSKDFIDYINSEINYDWAYHMMAHGNIYKKIKEIDEDEYYSFLTSTVDMKGSIGNQYYRQFLLAKIDRAYNNEDEKASNPYLGKYNFAAAHNTDEQKAFLQSEMIVKAFSKKYITETIPLFESFLSEEYNDDFGSKVVEAYEKSLVNAIGTKASNFVIKNPGEPEVSLSSLSGKTVYLNFWASWCRPCMKKMKELKPLEAQLKTENIEFIHISFDKNEAAWKNAILANGFSGTHVIVPEGVESSIAKEYEIRSIPQYFIIDKNGNFATKPTIPSVKALQKVLEKTSKGAE
jgi:thiol-disulfide isomerase/thioredoxin